MTQFLRYQPKIYVKDKESSTKLQHKIMVNLNISIYKSDQIIF